MAFQATTIMDQRMSLIEDIQSKMYSKTELAQRYGISRPTLDKWLKRFDEGGLPALEDRSRAPKSCTHRTDERIEAMIVDIRTKHPSWGGRKILQYIDNHRELLGLAAEFRLPAASTASDLLGRRGLLVPTKRRQRQPWVERTGQSAATRPAERYCIDFKGQFLMGNGQYCYGLTMSDECSRLLLVCRALPDTRSAGVQPVLQRCFEEYGLPERILSDNGSPFVVVGYAALSRLSVWWIKLGIIHDRSRPGCPQDNGRHERMHKTMKQQTARPPEYDLGAQQRRFDAFRDEYNQERPHEALGGRTPSMLWQPSPRPMPTVLPTPEYAGYFEVRRVNSNGNIAFKGGAVFLSETLIGESVGLEEVDDGIWSIWFYHVLIGRFDERTRQRR